MISLVCMIFVAVFIIVNRMFLSSFEMGTLILLVMLITTLEMYLSMGVRALKKWLE